MKVYKTRKGLRQYLQKIDQADQTTGFVPTMGALHEGHLSLIRKANQGDEVSIVSIFVNPTQFDEPEDLENYPREIEKDIKELEALDVNIVFSPSVKEMYPESLEEEMHYDFGSLEKTMEGEYREGHFQGVAQIVSKLLTIIHPHHLYLGQKDYQQFLIIKELIRQMNVQTTPVLCPIVREEDGLALSSRNVHLTKQERLDATQIYQTLLQTKEEFDQKSVSMLKNQAIERLKNVPSIKFIDYFEIVSADDLTPVKDPADVDNIIACTAVRLDTVRLIDNMFLKRTTIKLAE